MTCSGLGGFVAHDYQNCLSSTGVKLQTILIIMGYKAYHPGACY